MHRMLTISLITLALSILFAPIDAAAQTRQGVWFGIGAGYGSADATCDDCGSGDREGSGAAYLKGGYTLSEQWLLGVEGNLWGKNYVDADLGGKATLNMWNVAGTVTFYPRRSGGLFVKAGAGVALIDIEVEVEDATLSADLGKGLGVIVGTGYDIPLGRVAITPAVNVWYGQPGDLRLLGETIATRWKQNVVDVTLGITFP